MLTPKEREWLKNRGQWRFHSCRWCYAFPVTSKQIGPSPCVLKCRRDKKRPFCYGFRFGVFREAAEFEARVAAKLADIYFQPIADTRPSERLKHARLAVEEEMDGN
jgi:hypothetical protein